MGLKIFFGSYVVQGLSFSVLRNPDIIIKILIQVKNKPLFLQE